MPCSTKISRTCLTFIRGKEGAGAALRVAFPHGAAASMLGGGKERRRGTIGQSDNRTTRRMRPKGTPAARTSPRILRRSDLLMCLIVSLSDCLPLALELCRATATMPSVLTTPTPAPAPVSASPRTVAPRPRRRFRRFFRVLLLLVVLAVASLFIPAVFQVALRALIKVEAWQHHSRSRSRRSRGAFTSRFACSIRAGLSPPGRGRSRGSRSMRRRRNSTGARCSPGRAGAGSSG